MRPSPHRVGRAVATAFALAALVAGCAASSPREAHEAEDAARATRGAGARAAPTFRAPIDAASAHLYRSGDLGGRCLAADGAPIVDEIALEAVALFDTDSDRLRPDGERVLDQLVERVGRYESVRGVTLRAHADGRGTSAHNEALSARRAASVRRYLEARLDPVPPIREEALGEREPLGGDARGRLDAERRVVVRVAAEGLRPGRGSIALCARTARAPSVASALGTVRRVEPGALELGRFGGAMPLSPGDRVRLRAAGDETLDGIYEVGPDGALDLPFVGAVAAGGLRVEELEARLEGRLVGDGFVRAAFAAVDVAVLQLAPADVYVRGAVFNAGRKTVNLLETTERTFRQTQDGGDAGRGRLMSVALRAAGGVRPDADLGAVRVVRAGRVIEVDLSGILAGYPAQDLALVEGDEIEVPSLGAFQPTLVQPSPITLPGVRVFLSNLAAPLAVGSAVPQDASSLPYGSRLLQALLSGNCIGGTRSTNAARRAVLISENPMSGRVEVIERSVEQLLESPDDDVVNPLLMPNDGIACYDSGVTNLRDVARSFTDGLTPMVLLRTLFGG